MSMPLAWRRAAAKFVGSGAAFPTCKTPFGLHAEISTRSLLEALTPDLDEDRRAPVLRHIEEVVGVRTRSLARWPGESQGEGPDAETLAVEAARAALSSAGLTPSRLAGLVLATSTPPRWTGASAAAVSGALEAGCAFLDVRSGCAGGLYALSLGATLASASDGPILVIGTDTFSMTLPPAERLFAMSIGDGAGAVVLVPSTGDDGLLGAQFGGNGVLHHLATVSARLPPQTLDPASWTLSGDPEQFAREVERALIEATRAAGELTGERTTTCRLIHAGQRATCLRVARRVDEGRNVESPPLWTRTLEEHGNVGAASVLVALHEMGTAGELVPGRTIAIASAGGGPSWGGAAWTIS